MMTEPIPTEKEPSRNIFDVILLSRAAERKSKLKNLRAAISDEQRMIRGERGNIAIRQKCIRGYRREKKMMLSVKEIQKDTVLKQIEEIKRLDYIEKVQVRRDRIVFFYNPVKLRGNDIGKYKLIITKAVREDVIESAHNIRVVKIDYPILRGFNLEMVGKKIRMESKNVSTVHHHPHIDRNGGMCFGHVGDGVRRSLKMGNLMVPVEQFHDLIQSYNPDNGPYVKLSIFLRMLAGVRQRGYVTYEEYCSRDRDV